MNECKTCIHQKHDCGIVLQENVLVRAKYEHKCMCKECIIKVNCSKKCEERNEYIDQLIREIRDLGYVIR